jgi:hypothetical protein
MDGLDELARKLAEAPEGQDYIDLDMEPFDTVEDMASKKIS